MNTTELTPVLKTRHDLHLARKAWHMIGILFALGVFQVVTRWQAIWIITVTSCVVICIDFVRLKKVSLNKILFRHFSVLLRENERTELTALSHLLMGAWIVVLIFPQSIATLSLALLAVGDPAASVVGVMYGKDKIIGNKSLQGAIAGFVACSFVAFLFFNYKQIMLERVLLVSLTAGFIGAISELIPIRRLDDNFSFPILAASLLWLMFLFFGGF